jgi:hypothetical protein
MIGAIVTALGELRDAGAVDPVVVDAASEDDPAPITVARSNTGLEGLGKV